MTTNDGKLWGGRFEAEPSELLRRLNDSFAFDRELFAEDVAGSIAWVGALVAARALTAAEGKRLTAGLRAVLAAGLPSSSFNFVMAS